LLKNQSKKFPFFLFACLFEFNAPNKEKWFPFQIPSEEEEKKKKRKK